MRLSLLVADDLINNLLPQQRVNTHFLSLSVVSFMLINDWNTICVIDCGRMKHTQKFLVKQFEIRMNLLLFWLFKSRSLSHILASFILNHIYFNSQKSLLPMTYIDSCKMKTQCYLILLTLTVSFVICDSSSSNSGSDKSAFILPLDNAQRVERSPKYG